MKIILFCLMWVHTFATTVENKVRIDGIIYTIINESYNEYGDKGIEMKLYPKEVNLESLPLFSFALENQSGGCGAKSMEDGTYEINGTALTLYTHWDRSAHAYDAAKGDRIQHFTIGKNGTVTFQDGILYVEQQAENYDKESGLKYLRKVPVNKMEKEKLKMYIESTERIFGGRFVFGDDAVKLRKKVDNALMKKRQTRWK